MRIERITFRNFRKYVNTHIDFSKNDNDLHVIIADNGVGKTTFLNAMTWCLYNDEPKIKDKNASYSTLNTEVSNSSENNIEKASVSISVSGNGVKLLFKRTDVFKIHSKHSDYYKNNGMREEFLNQEFIVTETIENGESKIIKDIEKCNSKVSNFIPEAIKEFFFFDGEQLDSYFLKSSEIKKQVLKLSHIWLLERMDERLNDKLTALRKIRSPNKEAEKKFNEIEEKKAVILSQKNRLENLTNDYEDLADELQELLKKIPNTPSISKLNDSLEVAKQERDKFEKKLSERKIHLSENIINNSPKFFVKEAILKTLDLIERNNDETSIYYIDESILEDSINEHKCHLCDRELDENLINYLQEKKSKLFLTSDEEKLLKSYESIFKSFLNKENNYLNREKKILEDIDDFSETYENRVQEIQDIQADISLHAHKKEDTDRIDVLQRILPGKKADLIIIGKNIKELEEDQEALEKEHDGLCEKQEKFKQFKHKIKLCKRSLEVINSTKEEITAETRQKIQNETKELFFKLVRKNKVFTDVVIDEDYNVKLFEGKRSILGSTSASEYEIMALSFTLAIHSVSGFDAPLMIDTPLAKTSGIQRKNVAQACVDISKEKQMVLFLMPDEYSEEVIETFGGNHSTKYYLSESESEKEITIKEE